MPTSIWSPEVQTVFDQARVPGTRRVQVGDQSIEIPSPFPSPEDWRDRWIYFIMVDRFNNPGAPPRHLPWDSEYGDFQGGTINGIRQQLDYLQKLGAGALWLSPVLKNWVQGGPVGIHGTNEPWAIGHAASHGCIRLPNAMMRRLFDQVPAGTPILIRA